MNTNDASHSPKRDKGKDHDDSPLNDQTKRTRDHRLPGDLSYRQMIERMIRVDHAGEYGARRIYKGQLAILEQTKWGPIIRHMAEQEDYHYEVFDRLIVERRIRPTVLQPVWYVVGYALGAVTALLDPRAAMACTVAVEETIDQHYRDQVEKLGDDEEQLRNYIEQFRADELEHRDIGLEHDADQTFGYPVLYTMIKMGSRTAIWLSERI